MELQTLAQRPHNDSNSPHHEPHSSNLGQEQVQGPQPQPSPSTISRHTNPYVSQTTLSRWWTAKISVTIIDGPGNDPRDYLALERTYLGWIRTSLALVSFGVVVTQLFVLKDVDPTKGKVLGSVLTVSGMGIVVGSAVRYFRAQELLKRGKALTGGWEAVGIWVVLVVVLGGLFLVVVIET